jgi:hypothetical protein
VVRCGADVGCGRGMQMTAWEHVLCCADVAGGPLSNDDVNGGPSTLSLTSLAQRASDRAARHTKEDPLGRLLPTVRACRPRRDRVKARLRRFCTSRLDRRGADMSTRAFCREAPSRCASCSWGRLPSLLHHTTPPDTAPGRLTCCLVGVCCPVSSRGLVDSWVRGWGLGETTASVVGNRDEGQR